MSKHEDKAVATFTTVVQKCDGCDGLHEPYISCDQVGSIDKRKEPSKAVAPHRHKTRFDGELRFVEFASYEERGPTIMVYTKEAWERSERGDNPGPIGFIPVSKLPKRAPHRISREQAEKIARAGWSAIEYAGEDLRGPEYAKGYDAALAAAGITVEEQPQ